MFLKLNRYSIGEIGTMNVKEHTKQQLINIIQKQQNKTATKPEGMYVIRVDFKEGETFFPVFINTDNPDWKQQVKEAIFYFENFYSGAGFITTHLVTSFYDIGVADPNCIKPWKEFQETTEYKNFQKTESFLESLKKLEVSTFAIDILRKDLRPETNERIFKQQINELIADKTAIEKILKALQISKQSHEGTSQKRPQDEKGLEHIAYVNHPIRVASIVLSELKLSSEAVQAALLHDVVEDTSVSVEELKENFSDNVIKMVEELTKSKGESRKEYLERVKNLTDESKLIKCVDRFHNILRSFSIYDPIYLIRYIKETEKYFVEEFTENLRLKPLDEQFKKIWIELQKFEKEVSSLSVIGIVDYKMKKSILT